MGAMKNVVIEIIEMDRAGWRTQDIADYFGVPNNFVCDALGEREYVEEEEVDLIS